MTDHRQKAHSWLTSVNHRVNEMAGSPYFECRTAARSASPENWLKKMKKTLHQ